MYLFMYVRTLITPLQTGGCTEIENLHNEFYLTDAYVDIHWQSNHESY